MKKFFKLLLIFILIFTTIISLGLAYYMRNDIRVAIEEKQEEKAFENLDISNYKERVNILLLGVDTLETEKNQKGTRSDTIMILSVDPITNTAFILSIPRDSYVKISGSNEYTRINHAHSYGGTDLALATIKEFINIPIHHYVKVDYKALFKTVDDLGGVEFDVPVDMKYKDTAAKPPLNIDLKKGVQVLNAEQSMGLLRFREGYPDKDLGRIKVQQKFIKTVLEKISSPSSITKIPKFIDTIYQYVETDMTLNDVLSLTKLSININKDMIEKKTVPGQPGRAPNGMSVFLVDKVKLKEDIDYLFSGKYVMEESVKTKSLDEKESNKNIEVNSESNISTNEKKITFPKILILNGSGRAGVARRASDLLKIQDLTNEIGGNAQNFDYKETIIYYNKDEYADYAKKIINILESGNIDSKSNYTANKKADIVIIIGKDFNK